MGKRHQVVIVGGGPVGLALTDPEVSQETRAINHVSSIFVPASNALLDDDCRGFTCAGSTKSVGNVWPLGRGFHEGQDT
jgi:hypothetical protein